MYGRTVCLVLLLKAPGDQSTVTQPRVQAYQKRMQVIAQTSSQNSTNEEAAAALRSMLKDGGVGFSKMLCCL